MARVEDPDSRRSGMQSWRSHLGKFAVVYIVLACMGGAVLLSFVPDFFDSAESSPYRLIALTAVVVLVAGPVVAIGYIFLEAIVEGAVRGVGWLLGTCFRAIGRLFKRVFGGAEGQ